MDGVRCRVVCEGGWSSAATGIAGAARRRRKLDAGEKAIETSGVLESWLFLVSASFDSTTRVTVIEDRKKSEYSEI
ncbi:hypothetical protein KSP40_PGU014555 [Platanthera guangdongensis]|uniref:Uncharacterized protein n=1 Tax=Platanthera guangdongensis TaxID=2320717 RepID=A0ABR2N547_9ASPA